MIDFSLAGAKSLRCARARAEILGRQICTQMALAKQRPSNGAEREVVVFAPLESISEPICSHLSHGAASKAVVFCPSDGVALCSFGRSVKSCSKFARPAARPLGASLASTAYRWPLACSRADGAFEISAAGWPAGRADWSGAQAALLKANNNCTINHLCGGNCNLQFAALFGFSLCFEYCARQRNSAALTNAFLRCANKSQAPFLRP